LFQKKIETSSIFKKKQTSPVNVSPTAIIFHQRTASKSPIAEDREAEQTPYDDLVKTLTGTDRLRLAAILFRGIGAAQVAAPWTVPGTESSAMQLPKAYSYGPRYQL
jgi:hypothetical protein